jgi:DNA-binding NarL/FixJ family response regulator
LAEKLNYKIAENIQRKIIRLWLEGKSRKDIALICDVSEGTVSNVIAVGNRHLVREMQTH